MPCHRPASGRGAGIQAVVWWEREGGLVSTSAQGNPSRPTILSSERAVVVAGLRSLGRRLCCLSKDDRVGPGFRGASSTVEDSFRR